MAMRHRRCGGLNEWIVHTCGNVAAGSEQNALRAQNILLLNHEAGVGRRTCAMSGDHAAACPL